MIGNAAFRMLRAGTNTVRETTPIFVLFAVTRILLTIIGVVSRAILHPALAPLQAPHHFWWVYSSGHPVLDIWGVGDTEWYLDIANHGYSATPLPSGQANYVFFPLYPFLMRLLGVLIGGNTFAAALLISNAALLVACILLYRLVMLEADRNVAMNSVKYLLLFPTAFLFSAALSESLFLALSLASFYQARRQRWAAAGVAGFFASLTRAVGLFAFLPLAFEYFTTTGGKGTRIRCDIFFLLLIPLGGLTFAGYEYWLTGDPLAFTHTQWGKAQDGGLGSFKVLAALLLQGEPRALFCGLFTLISLMYLALYAREIGFSYWLLGMYSILVPFLGGPYNLLSMPRYILVIFPIYIILAKSRSRDPSADQTTTVVLTLLQGFLMALWTVGSYVVI
jgi:hypothetical protein